MQILWLGVRRMRWLPPTNANITYYFFFSLDILKDTKIWRRFFRDEKYIKNGFFLEMGALDGIVFSNSFIFEHCLGWNGILIEANAFNYEHLIQNRPCTFNVWSAACPRGTSHLYMSNQRGTSEIVKDKRAADINMVMINCRCRKLIWL